MKTDDFIVPTRTHCWLIPHNCELLKLLLKQQNVSANDFRFSSKQECQSFIRQLFLFALEDTTNTQMPSDLAALARDLIKINTPTFNSTIINNHETG